MLSVLLLSSLCIVNKNLCIVNKNYTSIMLLESYYGFYLVIQSDSTVIHTYSQAIGQCTL